MHKKLHFQNAIVYSFLIFAISTKGESGNEEVVSHPVSSDKTLVNTTERKEFHFNGSEVVAARAEAKCSVDQPCQNGGTCWAGKCDCSEYSKGDLCEKVFGCSSECTRNPEMICLHHQYKEIVYCGCRNPSLYYDEENNVCKTCPCENGKCFYDISYDGQELNCDCDYGYKEYNGYCKSCDCGYGGAGSCEFDSKGKKICTCEEGYYLRNGQCYSCGCMSWGDSRYKCEMHGNSKFCFCPEGYEDELGHCEDIDECEKNSPCGKSATCYNTFGSFYCKCNEGYTGPKGVEVDAEEDCYDIDECKDSRTPCWQWDQVKCVNLPGSYKCECRSGYEPVNIKVEPQKTLCVKTSKSWGPGLWVIFTTIAMIGLSIMVHRRVKKRAASSN